MKRVRPKHNKTPTTFTSATLFDADTQTYQNCKTISEVFGNRANEFFYELFKNEKF